MNWAETLTVLTIDQTTIAAPKWLVVFVGAMVTSVVLSVGRKT